MQAALSLRVRNTEFRCPPISEVLAYKNSTVIDSFCGNLDVGEDEATEVFLETLKWLWFCNDVAAHPLEGSQATPVIDSPLLVIDEMWHTFILHTRDYFEFCNRYFGRYLHHQPTSLAEKESMRITFDAMTPEARVAFLTEQKREQYNAVYDRLGRETFVTWYFRYPDQYPLERIRRLRRK